MRCNIRPWYIRVVLKIVWFKVWGLPGRRCASQMPASTFVISSICKRFWDSSCLLGWRHRTPAAFLGGVPEGILWLLSGWHWADRDDAENLGMHVAWPAEHELEVGGVSPSRNSNVSDCGWACETAQCQSQGLAALKSHPLCVSSQRFAGVLGKCIEFADWCWGFKRCRWCSRPGFYEMYVKTPAYSGQVESVL